MTRHMSTAVACTHDRHDNERNTMNEVAVELTTATAVEAVAWERAPRYPGRTVNRRIVCADGYKASVQASYMHYANDSAPTGESDDWPPSNAPYWRGEDAEAFYPFITFEIGATDSDPAPADVWDEYKSGGIWAWVPRQMVADLLDLHGGAVAWEPDRDPTAPVSSATEGGDNT